MHGTRTAPRDLGGGIRLLATAAVFIALMGLPASASAVIVGSEGKVAFQRWSGNNWDIWVRDSRVPQCRDGQNNDGEGDPVDFEDGGDGRDLGCTEPDDNSETDGGPPDPGTERLREQALNLTNSLDTSETDPAWAPVLCTTLDCDAQVARSWSATTPLTQLEQILAFVREGPAGSLGDIWAVVPPPESAPPDVNPTFANLTNSAADDGSPAFNRAGVMAFDSNGDVYAVPLTDLNDPDANVRNAYKCRLTSGPGRDTNPEWSPDGTHVIFQREHDGDTQLWVIDVAVDADPRSCASSTPRPVTAGQLPSSEPTWYDWSPGIGVPAPFAHGIAFTGPGERGDNDLHYFEQTYQQDAEPLTPFAGLDSWPSVTVVDDTGDAQGPSWSPFGSGFVFANGPPGGHALWFLDLGDTSPGGVHQLTHSHDDLNPAIQPRPQADVKPRPVCGRACQARRRKAKGPSVARVATTGPGVQGPGTRPACTIFGKPGNDRNLVGTPGPDLICGLGGNDFIDGRGGDDRILGGPGRDELRGGRGRDILSGGPGSDLLRGGPGRDRLNGGPGKDRMYGQGGADALLARDGSRDILSGGPGKDTIRRDRRDVVAGARRASA
jgi:RTX calcium-binding nonapeptide repeat (4 copies)/WD40-like Beta Propeller Repeat